MPAPIPHPQSTHHSHHLPSDVDSSSIESRSPYPPSTPTDSDAASCTESLTAPRMHALIAAIPDGRLRGAVISVVDKHPGFQRALWKELTRARRDPDVVAGADSERRQHQHRRKRHHAKSSTETPVPPSPPRTCVRCGETIEYDRDGAKTRRGSGCAVHPGALRDAAYEFYSRTPDGGVCKVSRTIRMWSCCDEDAGSPGCLVSRKHILRRRDSSIGHDSGSETSY